MSTPATSPDIRIGAAGGLLEAAGAALGALFTLGLFLGVAHFEVKEPDQKPVDFAELRALSVPMDAPPPRPVESIPESGGPAPFAGLDISPSDSEVKIAVVPPDLEQFIPAPRTAPAAAISISQLYTEFKPTIDLEPDFSRVFQQSEVDRIPTVLSRPNPMIPSWIRRGATTLRVNLMLLIDEEGRVRSARIIESSGNAQFDEIIARDAREVWLFTPAIRKGKRVRCMVVQPTRVNWRGGASPFES